MSVQLYIATSAGITAVGVSLGLKGGQGRGGRPAFASFRETNVLSGRPTAALLHSWAMTCGRSHPPVDRPSSAFSISNLV